MTDPRRLLEEGDAFERELIRTSELDRGSPSGMLKVLAATGAAAGLTVGSSAAAATAAKAVSGASSRSALHLLTLKWTAVLGAAGIGLAGVHLSMSELGHSPACAPAVSGAALVQMLTPQTSTSAQRASPLLPGESTPGERRFAIPAGNAQTGRRFERDAATEPEAAAPAPAASGTDLAAEVELLQEARTLLESNRYSEAIAAVERYRSSFSSGKLQPEAQAIVIEAMVRGGDRKRGLAAARSFMARWPSSPLMSRLRSLLPELGASPVEEMNP